MRLWSLILLFLLTVGLRAGDEAVPATTPAPAVTPATSNAPAPATSTATSAAPTVSAAAAVEASKPEVAAPAITYTEYRLANALMQVDVIDWQGAIRRVSLLGSHPVRLHAWQEKAREAKQHKVLDATKPLAVLDAFNAAGANHNWISGIGISGRTPWKKLSGDDSHLVLSHEDAGKGLRWTLRYDLPANSLALRSTLTVHNIGQADSALRPVIYPLNGVHQDDVSQDAAYLALVHHNGGTNGKMSSLYLPALPVPGYPAAATPIPADQLDYVCLKSRFFAAIWHPAGHGLKDAVSAVPAPAPTPVASAPSEGGPGATAGGPGGPQPLAATPGRAGAMLVQSLAFKDVYGGHQAYVEAHLLAQGGGDIVLKPTQQFEASWTTTIASMTSKDLEQLDEIAKKVEFSDGYYRFFKSLAWLLTVSLDWLVLVVQNYGVAVVVLTFLIKLALHRTTFKQHESMMKMQKLAPELKLLQEQYKSDKQKMAQKQMELWKKHGVNPLGGCLPILIQIPIFTALYLAFCHSADMRGSGFLWINDLTLPDQLIGWVIAGWNVSINPLPIIYIGVSIWMSLMQKVPPGADPQQEQMMKMMRWMPVLFGVIFYNFPSGLVLYFTINAVLSTIEIKMVRKKLGMH
jgi:YidC/Oxa1 family membrane protein insertase